MRSVAWISDTGRTVVFEAGMGPYIFKSLTSDLGATAETARAPRQDGVTTYHVALDTRTINLEGAMQIFGDRGHPALAEYDKARAWLHQTFAPNRWGTLIYYREDGAVQVRCRPIATPTIGSPTVTLSSIDISFVTDSPYWETAEEYLVTVGTIQRFWHFVWAPRLAPMGAFHRFGIIDNPSEELIYPTVEIYSTSQHVTLTNQTTGESITIEHAIGDGQKLTVELRDVTAWLWEQDEAGVYQQKEDVSHWMSLDSAPWGLRPGENQVVITNEVPEATPVAYIRYRVPSLGV